MRPRVPRTLEEPDTRHEPVDVGTELHPQLDRTRDRPSAATAGVAPADQIEHGHPLAAAVVVNDHVVGAAIALPAVSCAPRPSPCTTAAVASGAAGVKVAVWVAGVVGRGPGDRRVRGVAERERDRARLHRLGERRGRRHRGRDAGRTVAGGVVAVTVGGVVSGGVDVVVNDQDTGAAIALPATSCAPETVAVYIVPSASGPTSA